MKDRIANTLLRLGAAAIFALAVYAVYKIVFAPGYSGIDNIVLEFTKRMFKALLAVFGIGIGGVITLMLVSLAVTGMLKPKHEKSVSEIQEILSKRGCECSVVDVQDDEEFDENNPRLACINKIGMHLICFFVHSSKANAKENMKRLSDKAIGDDKNFTSSHEWAFNCKRHQINANGMFTYLCRINKSLLVIQMRSDRKEIVNKLAEELGY